MRDKTLAVHSSFHIICTQFQWTIKNKGVENMMNWIEIQLRKISDKVCVELWLQRIGTNRKCRHNIYSLLLSKWKVVFMNNNQVFCTCFMLLFVEITKHVAICWNWFCTLFFPFADVHWISKALKCLWLNRLLGQFKMGLFKELQALIELIKKRQRRKITFVARYPFDRMLS